MLSARPFKNLVFRPQSQGGQICVSWAHPLGPGLGPHTWARLGPTHLGPAWAHPRGPSLGPPTWARLGPTHLGPAWAHPLGFPDAAGDGDGAGAGRILKSRSRPLPTHPGMKYFRKETLAVDFSHFLNNALKLIAHPTSWSTDHGQIRYKLK